MDLAQDVMELKKRPQKSVEEVINDVEEARKHAEQSKIAQNKPRKK